VTLASHPLPVLWSRKSRAIPLLPLWAVRPVQKLSACTGVYILILACPTNLPNTNILAVLGAFAKLRKGTLISVMYVCPSAWNNSAPTGPVFTKFYVLVIFANLSQKINIQVSFKFGKNNGYFTWIPKGTAVAQWLRCCATNR